LLDGALAVDPVRQGVKVIAARGQLRPAGAESRSTARLAQEVQPIFDRHELELRP
jgi:hypothetical protein